MNAPLRPLSDLATIQTGIPFVASSKAGGGEPVFMPSALRGDQELTPDPSMVHYVKISVKPEDKYRLRPQDILLTAKATPTTLRCGYLSDSWNQQWLYAANLIRITTHSPGIHPRFLHAWLCHPDGRAALLGVSQSTTAQLNLTASALKDLQVPVPPRDEQIRIAQFLDIAARAHRHAVEAADTRLQLAREIAFRPLTDE